MWLFPGRHHLIEMLSFLLCENSWIRIARYGCVDVWMCRFRGHIAHASPKICNMPNTLENISPVTWVWCSHKFQFQRSSSQHLFGKSCVKGDKAVLCSGDVSLQQISARHNWEKSDPMSHPWLYNVCHQLLSTRAMAFLQRTTPNFAQFAKRSPDCVCNMVRFHQLLKNVLLSPAFEAISKSPVFWYYHCRAWGKNKPRLMVDQWKKSRSNNIKTQQTQRLEVEKKRTPKPILFAGVTKKGHHRTANLECYQGSVLLCVCAHTCLGSPPFSLVFGIPGLLPSAILQMAKSKKGPGFGTRTGFTSPHHPWHKN